MEAPAWEAQISPGQYYYAWEKWQAAGYKVAWDDAVIDVIQHDPEEAIQETIDFTPREEHLTLAGIKSVVALLSELELKSVSQYMIVKPEWESLVKEADASQDSGKTNTQNETNNG